MALCPSVSLPVCQRRCSVETVEPMTRCYKIYATKVTCLILSTARFHYAYFLELFCRFSEYGVSIYHNALVTGREVNIPDVNISCMQTALNFHARCSCVTVSKHYNRRTQRDARIASEMTVTCCSLLASRFGPSASRRVWRTDYAVSVDSCTWRSDIYRLLHVVGPTHSTVTTHAVSVTVAIDVVKWSIYDDPPL